MEYEATVQGSDYIFTIGYKMGMVDNLRDGMEWGVEDWSVTHVDGKPNMLGEFWAEQIDAERLCNAIMEQENA